MKTKTLTFAEIGELFDDATTRMVGGINHQNKGAIIHDINKIQKGLEGLLQSDPDDFQGVAGVHVQNIIDQLGLEKTVIKTVGNDPFAPKYINDIQRDLIDIVQGDEQLLGLATQDGHNGFAGVPDLLVPPAQFPGNAEQIQFMRNFIATSQDFADRAVALAGQNDQAATQQLIGEIKAYAEMANAFSKAQGGVYSARFDNEFAQEGVHGTASRAMIDGLETGNVDKVQGAAEVMIANAGDVTSNMLGVGAPPVDTGNGNGIPDQITTLAVAGTVFNDATTKLIGGLWEGNQQSVHDDLTATRQGIVDMLAQGQFQGQAQADANKIVGLLEREIKVVDNADLGALGPAKLNKLHAKVIDIVQNDPELAAAATAEGANGFMALPGTIKGAGHHGWGRDHGLAADDAQGVAQTDPLAHIFTHDVQHHIG